MKNKDLLDKLNKEHTLLPQELNEVLSTFDEEDRVYAATLAVAIREQYYGKEVYTRGLIEFTNYCRNDCYYCGIRKSNANASRYRLNKEEILTCAEQGYELGFRTFVLQGGEDGFFTDDLIAEIVSELKQNYADCAITLSVGEHSYETYQKWRKAGADRYLLRHETADEEHYRKLHPASLSLANRKKCLFNLKELGYQVGSGFMVGSPYQTEECLVKDLMFLKELNPDMIGIGPFIPHKDTPFKDEKTGALELTLMLLSILRLMFPTVLLPATTALGTLNPRGRELGILAGANVVMPNLSPVGVRKKYELYNNKICTGEEAAECRGCLQKRMESVGYQIVESRGDVIDIELRKIL
jgi:biotin synthase